MTMTKNQRFLGLAGLVILAGGAGCDGPITGWTDGFIFDETTLDSASSTVDHEFRVCKSGEATTTTADGEVRVRGVPRGDATGSIVISQWMTRADFESGAAPVEIGRGALGDRVVAPVEARAPFAVSGAFCGPWSVMRIELQTQSEQLEVVLNGSFEVEFLDDDAPLVDFDVEVLGWPD